MFPPAGSRLHANHRLGECGASPLPQPRLPCTPSVDTFRLHLTCTPSAYTFRPHLKCTPFTYAFRPHLPCTPSTYALRSHPPCAPFPYTLRPHLASTGRSATALVPVLRLIAIWVVVATSSSMFSVRNVLSNPTPRRAACHRSHSTPFELAFCQSGSPRPMPQSTLAHIQGTFRTRRRLLTTLLRHRPCGHSSTP